MNRKICGVKKYQIKSLIQLLLDYNVRVTIVQNYEIERIDSDYFTEE